METVDGGLAGTARPGPAARLDAAARRCPAVPCGPRRPGVPRPSPISGGSGTSPTWPGPPGKPLRVVHLGGGALTLARDVAATRPRSTQQVVEIDTSAVPTVLARICRWTAAGRIRVRGGDARAGLGEDPGRSADLIIADVFGGARTPAHLTSTEFLDGDTPCAAARRVLRRRTSPTGRRCSPLRGQIATARYGLPRALPDRRPGRTARQALRQRRPAGRRRGTAGRRTDPAGGHRPAGRTRRTRPGAAGLHRRRGRGHRRHGPRLARPAGRGLRLTTGRAARDGATSRRRWSARSADDRSRCRTRTYGRRRRRSRPGPTRPASTPASPSPRSASPTPARPSGRPSRRPPGRPSWSSS